MITSGCYNHQIQLFLEDGIHLGPKCHPSDHLLIEKGKQSPHNGNITSINQVTTLLPLTVGQSDTTCLLM